MLNWRQTVISQYATSPRLVTLLDAIDDWFDPNANLENFYNFIWNVDTAVGYGLDVWGRIVGVSRVVPWLNGNNFGFYEAGDRTGFNQSPFWEAKPQRANFVLSDDTYRRVILTKAGYNITNGSIPAVNALLMFLFPRRGNAFVSDGRNFPNGPWFGFGEAGDRANFSVGGPSQGSFSDSVVKTFPRNMTLTYNFQFALSPEEVAIVKNSGVLPKATGVRAYYRYLGSGP